MKYSVIIPCYKCEATLEKTVASIQACGLTDFEIILVDDGSPDGTPALCDRLAAERGNVRCFHQPNGGVSSARNHGLSEAQGDYVWFFDSDDLVDPGSMEHVAQIVEEHAPDMLIFGMRFESYKAETLLGYRDIYYSEEKCLQQSDLNDVFYDLYQCNSLTSSCNKLFKKSILQRHQISYDEKLFVMEDFLLVLRALKCCSTIYIVPQPIYRYIYLVPEKEYEDNTFQRLSRIQQLEVYLTPFKKELETHPIVYTELYYLLLRQKMSVQTIEEIKETALDFQNSAFASGEYDDYLSDSNRSLTYKLRSGRIRAIYYDRKKSELRKHCVSVVKRTAAYKWIKRKRSSGNRW